MYYILGVGLNMLTYAMCNRSIVRFSACKYSSWFCCIAGARTLGVLDGASYFSSQYNIDAYVSPGS